MTRDLRSNGIGVALAVILTVGAMSGCGGVGEGESRASQSTGAEASVGKPAPTNYPAKVGTLTLSDQVAYPDAIYSDGQSTYRAVSYAKGETIVTALKGTQSPTRTGGWDCGTAPMDTTGLNEGEAKIEQMLGPTKLCARKMFEGTVVVMARGEYAEAVTFGDDFLKAWK